MDPYVCELIGMNEPPAVPFAVHPAMTPRPFTQSMLDELHVLGTDAVSMLGAAGRIADETGKHMTADRCNDVAARLVRFLSNVPVFVDADEVDLAEVAAEFGGEA